GRAPIDAVAARAAVGPLIAIVAERRSLSVPQLRGLAVAHGRPGGLVAVEALGLSLEARARTSAIVPFGTGLPVGSVGALRPLEARSAVVAARCIDGGRG